MKNVKKSKNDREIDRDLKSGAATFVTLRPKKKHARKHLKRLSELVRALVEARSVDGIPYNATESQLAKKARVAVVALMRSLERYYSE